MAELIDHMKWILKKVANNKKLYQHDYLTADILLNQEYYSFSSSVIYGLPDDCMTYVFCLKNSEDLVEFIKDCEEGKTLTKKPFEIVAGNEAPAHYVVFDNLQQLQQSFAEAFYYAISNEKMYQEFLEVYKTFSSVMPKIIAGKKLDDFEKYIPDFEKWRLGEDEELNYGSNSDEAE